MISREELKAVLLTNCIDQDGNLDLSGLDFSDFDGDVILSNMNVKGCLHQSNQNVGGTLYQSFQKAGGEIHQSNHYCESNIYQQSHSGGAFIVGDKEYFGNEEDYISFDDDDDDDWDVDWDEDDWDEVDWDVDWDEDDYDADDDLDWNRYLDTRDDI